MRKQSIRSIFGSPYEKYFQNGSPNPAGDLLGGGIGFPTYRNDWWDVRELWTYPYYNLNIMLGDGIGSYRNESGYACELSPNTFFFTFPDLKSQYGPAKGEHWGELYASFAGDIFDIVRKEQIISPLQPVWQLDGLEPWIERLQKLLQLPSPTSRSQSMQRAVHFLDYLLELLDAAQPIRESKPDADWFTVACKMLTCDLHHKIDLQHIASELGMSYHTFRLYFTRRAGMSPKRYHNQVRLAAASELLISDTHKHCKEIAFELGFTEPHHFATQFKKQQGISPNAFRQKHRK